LIARYLLKLKSALLKRGLLRGESLSGHPEGAKATEGSPTTRWDAVPIEVRDAVPSEVRDASLTLGRTNGVERDC